MPNPVTESGQYRNITSTTTVYSGAAQLLGILCSTTSSGTVVVTDGATAVTGTITLTAGQWYPIPASVVNGITVTIANTANVTVFWNPA